MARRLTVALAGVTALLLLTACGSAAGDDRPKVFRVGFGGDPITMHPHLSAPAYNIFLTPVYETLIKSTPDGGYEPALATEWTLAEDSRSLALTLRPGVTFQDGTPFDAEAVRANLEAAARSGTLTARSLTTVDSVDVVDDTHVVLRLNAPGGHLVGVLASEAGMMISPALLDGDEAARNPVGTGPYQLTELTRGRTAYARWDGYRDADTTELDGIEIHGFPDDTARLNALRSGQLDASFIFPSQIDQAEQSGMRTTVFERTVFHSMLLNTGRSEFGDPRVRRAIGLALDRATMAQTLYDGNCSPAGQPYPETHWAHSPEVGQPEYDPEQAKSLLAEAGLPDGFTFTLAVSNITTYQRLGEAIQGELARIGITVNLDIMDNPSLTALRQTGNFDAVGGQYESGRPDPTTFLTDFYLPGGTFNPGDFTTPGGAELVDLARQSTDEADRTGPVRQVVADAAELGAPVVPVCFPGSIEADAPHVTHGVTVSIVGDHDFSTVRMD
ncbi:MULTISPECIES: ABC transporter substrate-binding protein [Pseudonocardia]|uniref:Glutathione-binding protein GsiB n=2 Tax=Pseudonocardia TaxID=1847 RepID=A0A1Y2ML67_PSEAH|nr:MULTISPECIES: ABC transporter substrate-binding protein [Pseudonocardia]OSY35729.1 Glutathione-binding protein GsiB precursor [Pseudonocardia autotrophica]TDN74579.1 peptide/nickel transport system substrate-binding protein [Pseudonocardia autotrophica]BBG05347.1 ABC transporter substrate-binding protein [Pseudonocardia autotrophica]GEC27471.1 ABC transporter substrate-binding protein [Pseudonocardia saturnea]